MTLLEQYLAHNNAVGVPNGLRPGEFILARFGGSDLNPQFATQHLKLLHEVVWSSCLFQFAAAWYSSPEARVAIRLLTDQ